MAKRNAKTKPTQRPGRVYGEGNPDDGFMPPDRPDVQSGADAVDMPMEVVDFRKGTSELAAENDLDPETGLRLRPIDNSQQQDDGTQVDDGGEPAPARQQPQRQRANDDHDDDSTLSRNMRKRVQRERAIANREKALREQKERELAAERVARQAVEDRVTRIERTQMQIDANGDVKALEAKIEALKPQIAKAVEDGQTAVALDLQIKLGEVQSNLAVLKQDLKYRAMNAEQVAAREAEQRRQAALKTPGTDQQIHPSQQQENIDRSNEFKKQNRHWWRRRENDDVRLLSVDLDKQILDDIAAGTCEFDPYSEEHFEELAFRMHEEYPDIEFCDLDGQPYDFSDRDGNDTGGNARRERHVQQNGRRGNGNGRPPQGGGGSRVRGNRAPDVVEMARRGQVTLTQADFDTMRTFKMDPNNAEHKKAFAQQRARTILNEAARGGNQ